MRKYFVTYTMRLKESYITRSDAKIDSIILSLDKSEFEYPEMWNIKRKITEHWDNIWKPKENLVQCDVIRGIQLIEI